MGVGLGVGVGGAKAGQSNDEGGRTRAAFPCLNKQPRGRLEFGVSEKWMGVRRLRSWELEDHGRLFLFFLHATSQRAGADKSRGGLLGRVMISWARRSWR